MTSDLARLAAMIALMCGSVGAQANNVGENAAWGFATPQDLLA